MTKTEKLAAFRLFVRSLIPADQVEPLFGVPASQLEYIATAAATPVHLATRIGMIGSDVSDVETFLSINSNRLSEDVKDMIRLYITVALLEEKL